jgi:hypothetical protein
MAQHQPNNNRRQLMGGRPQTPTLLQRPNSASTLNGGNVQENVYTTNDNQRVTGRPPIPPKLACAKSTIASRNKQKDNSMGARNMSGESLLGFEEALVKIEPPSSAQKSSTMKRQQHSPYGSVTSLNIGQRDGDISIASSGGGGARMASTQPQQQYVMVCAQLLFI